MSKERREVASFDKSLEELQIGDSVFGPVLPGWGLVARLPADIAEEWVVQHFENSVMARRWRITPSTGSIKNWEAQMGIVVGTLTTPTDHDKERLNLLYKAGGEDFRLYLSEATRRKK